MDCEAPAARAVIEKLSPPARSPGGTLEKFSDGDWTCWPRKGCSARSFDDRGNRLRAPGNPVFPCKADKTPWTEHGFKDATEDANESRVENPHGQAIRHRAVLAGT